MPMAPKAPFTLSSTKFDPDVFFEPSALSKAGEYLQKNDLESAIATSFNLPLPDRYVYHANASVKLSQAQAAVSAGAGNGLQDWYRVPNGSGDGYLITYPPSGDIAAYISIFEADKSAANTLKSFAANAKKRSLRSTIATWLMEKRYLDPSITVPKRKASVYKGQEASFINPYFLFWSWSCHSLQYAGPNADTGREIKSHHVLPIFMHHFACVCPSYEALEIIRQVAKGRTVLDIGSGAGYWTLMLRRHGCTVVAVDSQQSVYRICWINNTYVMDGVDYLSNDDLTEGGGKGDVLLLVYPIVGGDFTKKVIEAYKGDTICVAGTQNGNGYTGFKDVVVDVWMERERGTEWEMLARVPLPSFAGKDDALFVFRRRKAE